METLLLCLELMNVIGKALTHHRKILQNACAPILKNYHDGSMSSNIRPQLPDSIFLLSMCYPSTDLTSLASPFFPLLAVQSASFAFYAFHQATVRLRESLSIPPRRTFCKQQRILSLHSFLYHPIPRSPQGTQVYWCLLMAMNADIRSESFRHSLSHAQTLSSGGNRCRKLQWTLLRAVLWGFPTGQTKKGEHYALETNKADGTLNSCYFCFLYTNYRKKKRKRKPTQLLPPLLPDSYQKEKKKKKRKKTKKDKTLLLTTTRNLTITFWSV